MCGDYFLFVFIRLCKYKHIAFLVSEDSVYSLECCLFYVNCLHVSYYCYILILKVAVYYTSKYRHLDIEETFLHAAF